MSCLRLFVISSQLLPLYVTFELFNFIYGIPKTGKLCHIIIFYYEQFPNTFQIEIRLNFLYKKVGIRVSGVT